MKKKIVSVFLAGVLVFGLAACGGNSQGGNQEKAPASESTSSADNSGDKTESSESSESTESSNDSGAAASGETIDSGLFSAICPAGFMNIPQVDVFGEEDEEGNFPLNESLLSFCYGAESEWDVLTKPAVSINLEGEDNTIETSIEVAGWIYDNLEEKTFNIDGKDYPGYEAEYISVIDENDITHYQVVYVEDGGRIFSISIVTSMPEMGDTGLNVDNSDVQAIIKSVKMN